MAELSYDQFSKLLKCEPDTGKLFWLPRAPDMFSSEMRAASHSCAVWNSAHAGKEAFTGVCHYGYKIGRVSGRLYKAHRVVWLFHTGTWPTNGIDHINGVRADNRISNLRDVSAGENNLNKKRRSDNKSGVPGVYWYARHGKWACSLKLEGKTHFFGYFDQLEEAVARRKAAEIEFGFHPNHGRDD